jgi:arabinogalactan endo-1,4-beta-galactosidase
MKLSSAFPSQYIKAADLQGKSVTVKIDRVETDLIGSDKKLILYFIGKERGMVLNRTNANKIATLYGEETNDWQNQSIVLFEAMVDFKGDTVPAIRVRAPTNARTAPDEHPASRRAAPRDDDFPGDRISSGRAPARNADLDDEIPDFR